YMPPDVAAKAKQFATWETALGLTAFAGACWLLSWSGLPQTAAAVGIIGSALFLGNEAIPAGKALGSYLGLAATAESEGQIEEAAQNFSNFVSIVGVDGLGALLAHKVAAKIKDIAIVRKVENIFQKAYPESSSTPPPPPPASGSAPSPSDPAELALQEIK